MADPPWRFQNKTGKVAPEHRRLSRYATLTLGEICALPVTGLASQTAHLYLWCPNALLPDGLAVMAAWGFTYKSNTVWHKVRKDGSDGRGVGFYFRNVTELILFGTRGKSQKRAHMARAAACMEAVFSLPDLEPMLGPLDKVARDAVIQSLKRCQPLVLPPLPVDPSTINVPGLTPDVVQMILAGQHKAGCWDP